MSRLVVQHPRLGDEAVAAFAREVGAAPQVRDAGLACWSDVRIDGPAVDRLADTHRVDAEIVRRGTRLADFRLAAFDMDSTLITIECVDEIADCIGRKAEVSAITEAAMRGELPDYDDSLRRRVALLAGTPASVLEQVYRERVRLSKGAEQLVRRMKAAGLTVLLVSGGFTYFADRLKSALSLDDARANVLEIVDGRLTGRLIGEIVNAACKRRTVEEACRRTGCTPSEAIVVGDGANDLEMMSIAGISVAYHAKPIVRSETHHAVSHCGLDAILNFFDD
jgi:phosphoserine phosphatase